MDKQLYFGSYGHRYSDPCGGFMGFDRQKVAEAVESAIEYEENELKNYCEGHGEVEYYPEEDCPYCNPDICFYGISAEYRPVSYGYVSLAYLKENWNDLKAGYVVSLEPI